ncbi:MAG TPA: RNA ligase, partial [Polyangiaceae bacterium LLY-WYZ-15_(1-7)]|nr:RNA ligase [Polyangiaceae bacterium LLY-WYZ-15_(1-7)]
MRRLIVTRGPQGAGKTTFLRQLGLEPWLLSADRLREVHAGPVLTAAGTLGVSQEHDRAVWPELMGHLEARMERGELVCLDATHPKAKSFAPYRALVRRHRYAVRVVDFAPVPLARCLAQNAARPAPHAVPEGVLRATHEACLHGAVPDDFPAVPWSEDGAHADAIRAFLDVPVHDLSAYRAVLHVGDLQGCFAPLEALLEREGGLRDDVFHVFVGDLLDRGVENDAVFRWALEHLDRENVAIVWGNHETHLHRWARGLSGKSDEFDLRTRPQLEAAGFGPADADRLCDALHEVFLYRWKDRRVMVCHAGMSTVPERPALVSGHQWAKGVGYYADPVDALFDAQAPAGWVQVHGHRNVPELPLEAAPRSFNLEGKVEFGGALRALRLDAGGFTPIEVPSRRYRPIHERVAHGTLRDRKLYPRWVAPDMPPAPRLGGEVLEALRAHELVYEKRSTSKPWIAAFNFTRDAFFDRRWDALNTTARGLFVDVEEGLVVARSYDKFFNLGERPETTMGALKERLAWPVTGWVKENGYLGIVGYDAREEALVFASKSSLESDFAG